MEGECRYGASLPGGLGTDVPDIVIVDKSSTPSKVILLELSVPFDSATSFEAARSRKVDRYERLALDIKEKGFNVLNCPLKWGAWRSSIQ